MRTLRLVLAGASVAAALVPATASACQWEIYEETYETPIGSVTAPMARCVSP